jgi:hypothetical protein
MSERLSTDAGNDQRASSNRVRATALAAAVISCSFGYCLACATATSYRIAYCGFATAGFVVVACAVFVHMAE